VADYTKTTLGYSYQGGTTRPYKDLGIVQYRVIPYNKRLLQVKTEGSKSNDYQSYTYTNNTYSEARAANAPISHSTIDSEGNTITQYFTYTNINLNRIHTCVTVKQGKIIDAYRNEYDTWGRITEKYIALLDPASLPSADNYNAVTLTNELMESYLYHNNRLVQLTDHRSGISTVYLWSYKGTYPVAEIQNATFSNISNLLGSNTVNNLYNTFIPDMNLLNGLRTTLQESLVSTMTYQLLKGITSFTEPQGTTTYFTYNGFGQLKENYVIENGQKKIIQKMEYHWSH
jgi:YD repeat-containing protein